MDELVVALQDIDASSTVQRLASLRAVYGTMLRATRGQVAPLADYVLRCVLPHQKQITGRSRTFLPSIAYQLQHTPHTPVGVVSVPTGVNCHLPLPLCGECMITTVWACCLTAGAAAWPHTRHREQHGDNHFPPVTQAVCDIQRRIQDWRTCALSRETSHGRMDSSMTPSC